jgi:hypothetical protein
MRAVGKESLEISARIRDRTGVSDADAIESERVSLIGECSFQIVRG